MSALEKYAGTTLVVVGTAIALSLMRKKWTSRYVAYPPGPRGYPIIGNVFDFPESPIWEGFTSMAQEYSESTVLLRVAVLFT